jgi:hypothetical protein
VVWIVRYFQFSLLGMIVWVEESFLVSGDVVEIAVLQIGYYRIGAHNHICSIVAGVVNALWRRSFLWQYCH